MVEKILQELKTKYKDLGLGEQILKMKAKSIAKQVKEESEITGAVEQVEDDLRIFQSISDQNRTSTSELKKQIEELAKKEVKEVEKTEPDDMPAWAKVLVENNKAMQAFIDNKQKEDAQKTLQEKFLKETKEKGLEAFSTFFPKSFEDEDAIDSFISNAESLKSSLEQSLINGGLGNSKKPEVGGDDLKDEVSPQMVEFLKSKK